MDGGTSSVLSAGKGGGRGDLGGSGGVGGFGGDVAFAMLAAIDDGGIAADASAAENCHCLWPKTGLNTKSERARQAADARTYCKAS